MVTHCPPPHCSPHAGWVLPWVAHVGDVDVEDDPRDLHNDKTDGLAAEPVPVLELPKGRKGRSGLLRLCGDGHHGATCPPPHLPCRGTRSVSTGRGVCPEWGIWRRRRGRCRSPH